MSREKKPLEVPGMLGRGLSQNCHGRLQLCHSCLCVGPVVGHSDLTVGGHPETLDDSSLLPWVVVTPSSATSQIDLAVTVAIHMGRVSVVPRGQGRVDNIRVAGGVPLSTNSDPIWSQLDSVNLEDIFALRVPMLKSCPHFLRGRLRESFNLTLRERFRARLEGNVEAETSAWKFFGLILVMLLHRPVGTGSVGRTELAQRADDFARGLWTDLLRKACEMSPRSRSTSPPRTVVEEQERRGRAAQSRVQRGQVPEPVRS